MRLLCSTTAGDGHFGPLAAVARACAAAGHEVRVAAPASFAGAVGRAGLEHLAFPDAPAELMGPLFASLPDLPLAEANALVMGEVFGRLDAQCAFPALRDQVEAWRPDVVLRDPAEFGSLAAAEAAGVPHAEVAIGVATLMGWASGPLSAPLAELDVIAGLPGGCLQRAVQEAPVFTMVPDSMDGVLAGQSTSDPPRRTFRYRSSAVSAEGRLPGSWGSPERPLVYVTFGTVAAGLGHFGGVFGSALDALADLPIRVLLTTGYAAGEDMLDVPGNARVERFWPQQDVMPLAAVVVGHGGFGTTMSALASGVPQVVLPLFTTDQYLNADCITALGVGVRVDGGPGGARLLGDAVARVLATEAYRARAMDVAAEIAALPDEDEMVDRIARLPRGGGEAVG